MPFEKPIHRLPHVDRARLAGPGVDAKEMIYNDIAPVELARMREAAKPVHEKFAASYDLAVVTLFNRETERVSKF